MAKKPTITTVSSGYYSTETMNANFTELRDAFDNTVSLDGSVPNAMNADLDLNGNDILNVNTIDVQDFSVNGGSINGYLTDAQTAATSAAASASTALAGADRAEFAAASVSLEVADYAAIDALTSGDLAVGEYVRRLDTKSDYQRVSSKATFTTAGGIGLRVVSEEGDAYNAIAMGIDITGTVGASAKVQALGTWIANNGGGTLKLPAGFILFDTPVSITMPLFNALLHNGVETLTIVGAGRNATKILIAADMTDDWALTVTRQYNRQRSHVRDLTFIPLALKLGTPNKGALLLTSTWTAASGGWGVQHVHQCTISDVSVEKQDPGGADGFIENGLRIEWAFHPKVWAVSITSQTPWTKLEKDHTPGNAMMFYNCYLGEIQDSHLNGRFRRGALFLGDQNAEDYNAQDYEGAKVFKCTIDGEPLIAVEITHENYLLRNTSPREVGADILNNHLDGAEGGLLIKYHKDIRILGNKIYHQFAKRGDEFDYGIDRGITLEHCTDTTISNNVYEQQGWYKGSNLAYGANLAVRAAGASGSLNTAFNDLDTVTLVSFITPAVAPSASPGQVIFESGGSSSGISLILQNDMTLAMYAGTGTATPILTAPEVLEVSTQYTVAIEIDQTYDEIRLHHQLSDSHDFFFRGRQPEGLLTGFTQTTISGTDGCGVGVVNGTLGGFTGTVSGTTTFGGTITSNLSVWNFGDGSSECIFLDSHCRNILIHGEKFGTEGVGVHSRSDGDGTITVGINHWGAQFGPNVDDVREPAVKYLELNEGSLENRDVIQTKGYLGTSQALVKQDRYRAITVANASANAITIPTNASVPFEIGTRIPVIQTGVGVSSIVASAGVTLNGVTAGSCAITARWGEVTLRKVAADAWAISGDHGVVS